jgi:hypothetical protein
MQARDIFGLEGLAELGSRNGLDMRPTLLRILTDLYVHRLSHTPAEERHYTELALRLLEAVDVPTRVAVARRFARYPSPPLRVMQWIARDLPEVSGELRWHPLLQPPATAEPLATNSPPPSPAASAAATEEQLPAKPLHTLESTTADELNERFLAASAEERRLIVINLAVVAPHAAGNVRVSRDPETGRRLEAAALTGKADDFARLLARALNIPAEQARRLVRDDSGEAVVIAAKALGMAREVTYRVVMFLNPAIGRAVERVHALAALYDEITPIAAEAMVAIWQALRADERHNAKHRPLSWDDEQRRRARPATSARRKSSTVAPTPRVRANSTWRE